MALNPFSAWQLLCHNRVQYKVDGLWPAQTEYFGTLYYHRHNIMVVTVLYFKDHSRLVCCVFSFQISQVHNKSVKIHAKAKMADFKLTFVPLIFLLLRMWGLFLAIPHCYLSFSAKATFRQTVYNAVFVFLMASISTLAIAWVAYTVASSPGLCT